MPHFTLDDRTAPAVARLVTRLDGMPLAIELAAAQVEALGVTGLLGRLDERLALLAGADRLAPSRQRSLAATVAWSYQLLDEAEQRVFRAVSVFPSGFTLEGAEAVAGEGRRAGGAAASGLLAADPAAGRARWPVAVPDAGDVARLRGGPAGRGREQDQAAAALAGYALAIAEEAAAGLQIRTGEQRGRELAGRRGSHHAAGAGLGHGPRPGGGAAADDRAGLVVVPARPADRSAPAARRGHRVRRDRQRRSGARQQFLLAWAAEFSVDYAGAVEHFTALRDAVADRPPSPALADALAGRSYALRDVGRFPEATADARRALVVAREAGHPFGEVVALLDLALAAAAVGDMDDAVQLAQQARQVPGDIPASIGRTCSVWLTEVLIQAGDFAAAERICTDGLAASRDAGDMVNQPSLLARLALLDLLAGRTEAAAAYLREALKLAVRTGIWFVVYLDCCGHSVRGNRAPGRGGHAVGRAMPRSCRARMTGRGTPGCGRSRCARPGGRWARARPRRPRNAGRRWAGPPRPSTP